MAKAKEAAAVRSAVPPAVPSGGSAARGARPSRAAVIDTATRIVDRCGWDALSLAAIAGELRRHPTSLYAHVESIEAVRREVVLAAMRALGERTWRAALGRTRDDALVALAHAFRDYLTEHPGLGHALLVYRPTGDDVNYEAVGHWLSEPVTATMESFGLDGRRARHAQVAFSAAVRGYVAREASGPPRDADADTAFAAVIDVFLAALGTGQWPGS